MLFYFRNMILREQYRAYYDFKFWIGFTTGTKNPMKYNHRISNIT